VLLLLRDGVGSLGDLHGVKFEGPKETV
jgi:hypothetical protein